MSHTSKGTSTAKIRKALEIDKGQEGSRALYTIVFRKFLPITQLAGHEFLRAWCHAVECHHAIWKNGVHRRDVNPINLIFYYVRGSSGQLVMVSVLNDYDLSSLKNFPRDRGRTTFSRLKSSKAKSSICTSAILNPSSGCLPGSVFGMRMASL
ncbi:hypothetical protein K503DRAFT_370203 [Rhizopogon vinicolor AM-OR11-026]|uniref:Fungal-type protein kinase domain-containing protein n=1 Tax=Rhizopogon vinicolor AM-OR11-026 TaxID=1314800 RepID=A0A1B7MS45_9AGAM|nr:hypothetical protein K503DRAFT_370203 [Rhizopogon vinicolor AM-OR11-026]